MVCNSTACLSLALRMSKDDLTLHTRMHRAKNRKKQLKKTEKKKKISFRNCNSYVRVLRSTYFSPKFVHSIKQMCCQYHRQTLFNFKPKYVHPIKNLPLSQKDHCVSPEFSQPIKI